MLWVGCSHRGRRRDHRWDNDSTTATTAREATVTLAATAKTIASAGTAIGNSAFGTLIITPIIISDRHFASRILSGETKWVGH